VWHAADATHSLRSAHEAPAAPPNGGKHAESTSMHSGAGFGQVPRKSTKRASNLLACFVLSCDLGVPKASCIYSWGCQKQVASMPGGAKSKLHLFLGVPKASCIYSWGCQKQVASIPGGAKSKLHLVLGVPKASCIYSWGCQKQVASIPGGAKSKLHLFLGVPKAGCIYSWGCQKQVASIPGGAESKLHLFLGVPKASCIYSWGCQKQVASILLSSVRRRCRRLVRRPETMCGVCCMPHT
jgi:hypothetical protein